MISRTNFPLFGGKNILTSANSPRRLSHRLGNDALCNVVDTKTGFHLFSGGVNAYRGEG